MYQWSSLRKLVDYYPRVRWVQNALQKRKMSLCAAEDELYETRQPCKGMIEAVRKWLEREEDIQAEERRKKENGRVAAALRPFKPAPKHVQARIDLWRAVMEQRVEAPTRSKPIVIDGPSQMGKSQWAQQWWGADRTLTVNCQDCVVPPLRDYAQHKHKFDALMFEEGDWRLIYNNKMLFQSTNSAIDMGRSATNCHHYRLRCHCTPMFVLSTDFYNGIEQNESARQYVEANVEYWRIDARCSSIDECM